MQKTLFAIIMVLFLVLFFEVGYLALTHYYSAKSQSTSYVIPNTPTVNIVQANFKILYQVKGDVLGKTIAYEYQDATRSAFKGYTYNWSSE